MFDPQITTDIQSFLMGLSSMPLGNLIGSIRPRHRYGYIGMKDRMMYSLITPGAIVQIDEQRKELVRGPWHHESERPIYFLEMRTGFPCCWCAVEDGNIILQPHPLSPSHTVVLPLNDVDVMGHVVAVAMRLNVFADTPRVPKLAASAIRGMVKSRNARAVITEQMTAAVAAGALSRNPRRRHR